MRATLSEFVPALRITWYALSAALLLAALIPLVLAQDALGGLLPACSAPPCALCGLTTSFYAVAGGRLGEAASAHPLGPALYVAFLANALLAGLDARPRR